MSASSRPSSYHYVVDEPLLRTIAAEIQAAIPGAQVRLFGSRARATVRPDSDLNLLVRVSDAWLGSQSRLTGGRGVALRRRTGWGTDRAQRLEPTRRGTA